MLLNRLAALADLKIYTARFLVCPYCLSLSYFWCSDLLLGPAVRSLEDIFFQTLKLNPDDTVGTPSEPLTHVSKLGRIRCVEFGYGFGFVFVIGFLFLFHFWI
jgi:hypothetical protein